MAEEQHAGVGRQVEGMEAGTEEERVFVGGGGAHPAAEERGQFQAAVGDEQQPLVGVTGGMEDDDDDPLPLFPFDRTDIDEDDAMVLGFLRSSDYTYDWITDGDTGGDEDGLMSVGGGGASLARTPSPVLVVPSVLPDAKEGEGGDGVDSHNVGSTPHPRGVPMVRSVSVLSEEASSSSSHPSSDGDETMSNSDDESSSSSGIRSSRSYTLRRVSFNENVRVLPIPPLTHYTPAQKSSMYATRLELRSNKLRNRKEYEYDGCNWRNVTEERCMVVCPRTGEFMHPAHVLGVQEEQQRQFAEQYAGGVFDNIRSALGAL